MSYKSLLGITVAILELRNPGGLLPWNLSASTRKIPLLPPSHAPKGTPTLESKTFLTDFEVQPKATRLEAPDFLPVKLAECSRQGAEVDTALGSPL